MAEVEPIALQSFSGDRTHVEGAVLAFGSQTPIHASVTYAKHPEVGAAVLAAEQAFKAAILADLVAMPAVIESISTAIIAVRSTLAGVPEGEPLSADDRERVLGYLDGILASTGGGG